ncbi:MAG: AAA family ATPase [Bacteroidales bacterium]|nr:AAA family ATPase [Bacteroidales bacterium]
MLVIGITGTLGSGKGTVVKYLMKQKGFTHFSVRDFLLEEIAQRGMTPDRDSMVIVANALRKANSPSYITDKLYEMAIQTGNNCVIESIRTPGEVVSLRSKALFCLLAVDADEALRYQRILLRDSETDHISFATFLENEKREMTADDPNKQNLRACIQMADFSIINNGTVKELEKKTENILYQIQKNIDDRKKA